MWYLSENGDLTKPANIDNESSNVYAYIRKDFEIVEATSSIPAHWKWKEMKVRKEDWAIYEQVMDHETALSDVYAALTELAELIVEG